MSASSQLLTTEDVQQINWGNALEKDYYVLLEIRYEFDDEDYERVIADLMFDTPEGMAVDAYTVKVAAGVTMGGTIRGVLLRDFNYPPESGTFFAEARYTGDSIPDKSGNRYGKVLTVATVSRKFETADITPQGMKIHWEE